jgi:TatD DNase family protein
MIEQSIQFIDTHAHLSLTQFDQDREAAVERATHAQVTRIIEIGFDLASSRAAIALAEAHPQIFAVVGVQPNHLNELPATWLSELRAMAAHPRVVAIGEIGLDFYWMKAPLEAQEQAFRVQLALARELGLPVVIHSRDAAADTLRILDHAARGQPGVMHSFLGDWSFAQGCLDVGFMLSFSGPLTFSKSTALHEVARLAPVDRLLTETDSPYLSPNPLRGQRNEPANVTLIARQLATLRKEPLPDVAKQVWTNAEQLFPRLRA